MTAPLLPPGPWPSKPGSTSENKHSGSSDKSGDSEFDTISNQERQRLDRNSEPQSPNQRADNAERKNDQNAEDRGSAAPAPERSQVQDTELSETGESAPLPELPDADNPIVFSFANLQALAEQTVGGDPAEARATTAQVGTPGGTVSFQAIPQAGSTENGGKLLPGQSVSQMMDSLLGQTPDDGVKVLESTSNLSAANRLTGADLAGQLAQSQAQASGRLAETPAPLRAYATSIELPVGHAEWGDKLVGKLTWLTANKLSVAEIHLTPPDMGPMEVRVKVQQDQATVTVHAANPVVRDQLELHSHRLRDMLNEQGISLDQFDVADSRDRQGGGQESGNEQGSGTVAQGRHDDPEEHNSQVVDGGQLDLSWRGEVDLYA